MVIEGIGANCAMCGNHYVCTDGDPFCSGACYDAWSDERSDDE